MARDSLAVEVTFLQSSGEWVELTGHWEGKKHFGQNTALMPGFVTGTYWVEGEREKNENVKTINQTKNLRQVDLRNGLIQIFLFDRWTEFLALYSGSYGVRPRAGWGGRGGRSGLWDWTMGNHRSLAKLPETTEFHHWPILPIVHTSYLNSKSFAYDPSSWKHPKMWIYVGQLLYCSRCCAIRLKMFSYFFCLSFSVLFVWKVL